MTNTEDLLKDFVNDEVVEFEVNSRKFNYKPTTAGDENSWLDEYLKRASYRDEEGNLKYYNYEDRGKINECKLRNITKVPYTKEVIDKILGVNKEWSELDKKERYQLLSKLDPSIFSEIIQKINEIDRNGGDIKN